jgi:hypothetical protein
MQHASFRRSRTGSGGVSPAATLYFGRRDVKKGMAPAIRLLFATGVDPRLDYLPGVRGVEDVALERSMVSALLEPKCRPIRPGRQEAAVQKPVSRFYELAIVIDAVMGIEPALVLSLELLPRVGLGDTLDLQPVGTVEAPYGPRLHWFAFYFHSWTVVYLGLCRSYDRRT